VFELFLNPANMAVGAALVSAPVIIHLINRLRFRRVRWAAMEFLLKSQKRNRRRLVIEQLILLALRCLLVVMAGVLLARFLGFAFAGFQARNTTHVVVLDDRLSSEDTWKSEGGEVKTSFGLGKQLVEKELARTIAQARTPQRIVLLRLSAPATRIDQPVNDETLRELPAQLAKWEAPTALHLDLLDGVRAAKEVFDAGPQDERFLHVVSDLRQAHWAEPEAARLRAELQALSQAGVKVHFLDTAHPHRGDKQRVALYHDNLAVAELRPETRVAAEGMPVQFTVTLANYSASERKNVRVTVKVNGEERPEGSLTVLSAPPGRTAATFLVGFVKLGPNVVTAQLENEEAGLPSDNLRFAVIDVKRQVPVLVIDGDRSGGDKPGGDTFHLRTLLTAARGYEVVRGAEADLERPNLDQYPSIYLLNVEKFTPKAAANLENYLKGGGGVAFFLGDRVRPANYNELLYKNGQGVFPAPLADQASKAPTEEEKQERLLQNLLEPRQQAYVRSDSHPVVAEVYKYRNLLNFLSIDRHFPVARARWNVEEGKVEELVTLPNDRPVADYQASAQEILDSLPVDDPQYERFRPALEKHRRAVRDTLTGKHLHLLAAALDNLLRDPRDGTDGDGAPRLTALWEQPDPKVAALKTRVEKLMQAVQFGDPLVLANRFGRGRVVTFLTTAGKKWNDWAGGSPASVTYPMVMIELQKYLTAADQETDKTVGQELVLDRPAARYEPRVRVAYMDGRETVAARPGGAPAEGAAVPTGRKDLGEVPGVVSGEHVAFAFDRAKTARPGVYEFTLLPRTDGGGEPRPEAVAFAFNVDTDRESDLRRAALDDLERLGTVHAPEAGTLAGLVDPHRDLSESAWFYLLFLAVLVAEQALAVHLSFHLKGSEAPAAPAQRPKAAAA
jgi:hypothetical protein